MINQIALATLLLAPGQDPANTAATRLEVALKLKAEGDTGRQTMNEQIEVMRALLIHKLRRDGGATTQPLAVFGDTFDPTQQRFYAGSNLSFRGIATGIEPVVEGAYLDGYGVVFEVSASRRDEGRRIAGE